MQNSRKNKHIDTVTGQKEFFAANLHNLQQNLNEQSIDYRIIGSVAAQAILEDKVGQPVRFDRPGAIKSYQAMPDIDIIVPRKNLEEVRDIRERVLASGGPKIGLANATGEIDFRPDEERSFLTHKDISIPVDNRILRPEMGDFNGVNVRTLSPEALLQTYGTFGGYIREKDMANIKALVRAQDSYSVEDSEPFRDFRKLRRQVSPGELKVSKTMELVDSSAPPILKNAISLAAIKAADMLGRR